MANIQLPFTRRDKLGRYYTELDVSDILVSQMDSLGASSILDLGSGSGNLSCAASLRWKTATITTIDIESDIKNKFSSSNHITADALNFNLPESLGINESTIDIALCNPPYIKPIWNEDYQKLSEAIGIEKYTRISSILSSEVIFLAQTIRMLKYGGEAGVILPDGIFSAQRLSPLREYLINEHEIKKIIQLPRKTFKKTEAKTHIAIFNKNKKTNPTKKIELYTINEENELSEPIEISDLDGINRLDYSYYNNDKSSDGLKIGDIAIIKRGKHSSKEIRKLKLPTIHTTDLCGFDKNLCLPELNITQLKDNNKYTIACSGDILMSRVGRGFSEKIAFVNSGNAIVSDCIFIIRGNILDIKKIYDFLTSSDGQNELNRNSYGVGAAQISMDLLKKISIGILP